MARPKNTKGTKWVIHHEDWFEKRKEAINRARVDKLPYEIKKVEGAKTYFGTYRRNTWRLRTFTPSLYRGQKPRTAPIQTRQKLNSIKRGGYHKGYPLVRIRGGSWLYLEGPKSAAMRSANKNMKRFEFRQAARRAGKDALKKLIRL